MIRLNEHWTTLLNSLDLDPYEQVKDKRIENWKKIISNLPLINTTKVDLLNGITVQGKWDSKDKQRTEEDLMQLVPWRKGPFMIQDIFIDAEWQSNMKWERVLDLNIELKGKNILDVGSGNGYYGFRMLGKGAEFVVCLEPNVSHLTQFLVLNHFINSDRIKMVPRRIEEISFLDKCFDLVFSMGVLYHQRNPESHLNLLASHLKEGGQIILETLIAPDEYGQALIPKSSYANMSNVWFIHSRKGLEDLINKLGLKILKMGPSVKTMPEEQRATKWMPFRSLVDGLSQGLDRTVEGLPSPDRVVLVLTKL
tara:strand:+ start:1255 stop:2184 length:930 start_codon:yes stop_codon:yes gene_type:complete